MKRRFILSRAAASCCIAAVAWAVAGPTWASMCTPAGGAPAPVSGSGLSIGGAIGVGVGGNGVDAFVSGLAGGLLAPPASACAVGVASSANAGTGASPAAPGEPASVPFTGLERAAGNPVDVVTGNKYQRQVDVVLPHPESSALSADGIAAAFGLPRDESLLLLFARHYNSRSDFALSLGRGWSHSFDTRLARLVRGGRVELQILQGDGRRLVFRPIRTALPGRVAARGPDGARRRYATGRIEDGLVDEDFGDAKAAFAWRWPGGRRVIFDADGRLATIVAPDLDAIRLRRDDAGRLVEATDASGRALGFEYDGARLAVLRLPDGQPIRYEYDRHGQLARVVYPDGRTQRYHYDDERAFRLLTGITDTDGRRSRYDYDDALRVARTQGFGERDAQALRFSWRLPRARGERGTTTLTQGERVSRYQWVEARDGQDPVLVAGDGDGCARCPSIGRRARVDRAGRVVEAGGLQLHRDTLGRVIERRVVAGGAQRAAWAERLSYEGDDPLAGPARIERPSVVAGRVLRVASGYGMRGQLESVEVEGFAPGTPPERIAASLRFEYAPSGPARGKLVAIVRHGSAAGAARTVFTYDAQRRLVRIEHAGMLVHSIERDALGRAVLERLPDGTQRTRAFDGSWRLASTGARATSVRFRYDDAGRPIEVAWSDGRRWSIGMREDGVTIESSEGWRKNFGPGASGEARDAAPPGQWVRSSLPVAMARAENGRHSIADAAGRRTDFLYDDLGRLVAVRSPHAGSRTQHYDALGRLARLEHGDGAVDVREHDLAGRIVRREQSARDERIETRFGYDGARLVAIEHPARRSRARHDAHGRLVELVHEHGSAAWRQQFRYDALGRLSERVLPDGSRLLYGHDGQGRAQRLDLVPAGDTRHRLIAAHDAFVDGRAVSTRLGNGVRFERRFDASGRPLQLSWTRPDGAGAGHAAAPPQALPSRRLRWHAAGLPLAIAHEFGEDRYGYDRFGRLIVRERHAGAAAPDHVEYFLHDAAGDRLAARRRDGSDWQSQAAPRDDAGRPLRQGRIALRWGAQRRIVEASGDQGITRYRYDAFGQRVARSGAAGERGFLYHAQALAAETGADGRLLRQYLRWNGRVVAVLEHAPAGGAARQVARSLFWVHADHLGTPIAVSDASAAVVWRGDLDAFGRLARAQGSFAQPLRLDGQYFDAETGLHDNLLRTYDPDSGRYLEPDPLGLAAGLNPFAYADGNPLVATDPLGLLLFAFDGTGNDADGPGGDDVSNVRKFFEQYDDPNKWYMAGVGRDDPVSGIGGGLRDLADAGTARERVDWMIGTLDSFLGDAWAGKSAPVDVVGFSRGAAMARDFVNRVSTLIDERHFASRGVCVDLRFLGLWDTVAQFGLLGLANAGWKLAIPSAVRATFHAVALNEHRSLFPLESALGGGAWVVERGFIGEHSDVGGSNAEGDLSDVSLVWMTQMARALGVPLRELHPRDRIVTDPRLHDRNYTGTGDRYVLRRDATGRIVARATMRQAVAPGMSWRDTAAYIVPFPRRGIDAHGQPSIVGEVDMNAYAAWLKTSYGIEVGF